MSASPAEQNSAPAPAESPAEAATPSAPTPPAESAQPAESAPESDLDPRVRKLIDDVRGDFKAERAKRQEAEQAFADFKRGLTESLGKTLGIVEEDAADPTRLTEQLTKAQHEQRQAALELSVFRAAPDTAIANALLDSRSFLAKVADIDPTDGLAMAAAVGEALKDTPSLIPARPGAPAPNPAQGSSSAGPATPAQMSQEDVERLFREKKYDEIEKARSEGRLDQLLGA